MPSSIKRNCACNCAFGKRRPTCTHRFSEVRLDQYGLRKLHCATCGMSEYEHDWVVIRRGREEDGNRH